MIKIVLIPQSVFTFVDDEGVNIHIDSGALRTWCMVAQPEIVLTDIRPEIVKQLIDDNAISLDRARELADGRHLDPVIFAKDGTIGDNGGPNVMLVDGHHRYFIAAARRQTHIESYVLEVEQWKPFQLHNLPNVTADQLRTSPITKRNY